ncbi:MAG: hypothetical protein WKF87_15715 [Chryseolinea sp.]
MNIPKTILSVTLILICSMPVLISCEEPGVSPAWSGYIPLASDTQIHYKREWILTDDDETIFSIDTLTFTISDDTLVDGKRYKKIIDLNSNLLKIARREGSSYFGRDYTGWDESPEETMFFDATVAIGDSWSNIVSGEKREYIVQQANASSIVNGINYENVIKIKVNYYAGTYGNPPYEYLQYSTEHWYAPRVGEIYSYYPCSISGCYCDFRLTRI